MGKNGFCNYCFYVVIGTDSKGKRKLKKLRAVSEEAAIRETEVAGIGGPFEVRVEPLEPPTDRQLALAEKINLTIPEGSTKDDLAAILDRRLTYGDGRLPDPELLEYARARGVCFSTLECESQILQDMIGQLRGRELGELFAYAVYLSRSGLRHFKDPRNEPFFSRFQKFGEMVETDPALRKSLEGRGLCDFKNPETRSKAYRAAVSCL